MSSPSNLLPRCADVSRAFDEPLAGTGVKKARLWLLVEDRSQWERKAFKSLPRSRYERLDDFEDHVEDHVDDRVKMLAIRHLKLDPREPHQLIVADSEQRRAWSFEIDADYERLAELDIAALIEHGELAGATELNEPLYLVCMHAQRDKCCSRLGAPIYKALREELGRPQVWAASHVGGHRFAANVIALPHGLCYGHIDRDDVGPLLDATRQNEVYRPADRLRGLSLFPRHAQAADAWARARTGSHHIDAVRVTAWQKLERRDGIKRWRVDLAHDESLPHAVEVRELRHPERRITSCGDDPDDVEYYEVVSFQS